MSNEKRIVTGVVRVNFVNLAEPEKLSSEDLAKGKKPQYSVQLLIPKTDTDTIERMLAAQAVAQQETFGKVNPKMPNTIIDGDDTNKNGDPRHASNAGHWVVSVKSQYIPEVQDQDHNLDRTNLCITSGDYCYVSLQAKTYDNVNGKGAAFYLGNLRLVKKGDALGGGGVSADSDFAHLPATDNTRPSAGNDFANS